MVAIEVDSQKAERWVDAKTGLIKFLSSLVCVLGGGAIGREGPTIQIAASIFYSLGMPFRRIWPTLSHQSLLVAGGSAGIAAAFNTPLGGIVFAVEELSQQHFHRFKTFLISAVIVAGLVAQWLLGPYLYLGYPRLAPISFSALPWASVVGVLGGIAGACFGRCIVWTARFNFLKPSGRVKLAILVGLLTALSGWLFGSEVLGSGSGLVTRVLFQEADKQVDAWTLVGRFFNPIMACAVGGATGLFGPSLSAGAAIGAWFAQVTASPYPNLSVLLGMTAFLSGMTRAPFTAFVLVLEMTDRHSAIFPLMMASLLASLVAKLVDGKSYYERRCEAYLQACQPPPPAPPAPAP
jgi:H+/Cl- antiporter ClcA